MDEPRASLAAEHIPHCLLAFAYEAACHHIAFLGSLLHAGHHCGYVAHFARYTSVAALLAATLTCVGAQ